MVEILRCVRKKTGECHGVSGATNQSMARQAIGSMSLEGLHILVGLPLAFGSFHSPCDCYPPLGALNWQLLPRRDIPCGALHGHSVPVHGCWMIRDLLVVQKISLLQIISTATVLLAMVVESSRAFHVVG